MVNYNIQSQDSVSGFSEPRVSTRNSESYLGLHCLMLSLFQIGQTDKKLLGKNATA